MSAREANPARRQLRGRPHVVATPRARRIVNRIDRRATRQDLRAERGEA